MIYTHVDQIKCWIEANLNYFWNYPEEGYFFLDLEMLPFETNDLKLNFAFTKDHINLWDRIFATTKYLAIDVASEQPVLCISSEESVQEFDFNVNTLNIKRFENCKKIILSDLELNKSYHNLLEMLSGN